MDGLILFFMSVVLLTVGIGQIRYRRWARIATVYWGFAALLVVVGFAVAHIVLEDHVFPFPISSSSTNLNGINSAIEYLIVLAPYPGVLLAFYTRRDIKKAMTD